MTVVADQTTRFLPSFVTVMTGTWFAGPGSRIVLVSLPVAVLQILIVLSPLVLMSDLLSVVNASAVMGRPWPTSVNRFLPVVRSHRWMLLSSPPDARNLPSGLAATATTSLL